MKQSRDSLIGKPILNEQGVIIGTVKDFLVDASTGENISVLITPDTDTKLYIPFLDDTGKVVVPISQISHVQDALIVETIKDTPYDSVK